MTHKVGIAIAVYNSCEQTRKCLEAIHNHSSKVSLYPVVVDDQSSDGTWDMLQSEYPEVVTIQGDGNLWWTGGTNLAIEICLKFGCDYVLLLNPDVFIEENTVVQLVDIAETHRNTIVASVVVSDENPSQIWWAGSKWLPITPIFPLIWSSRYIFKRGVPVTSLPNAPYSTSEAHGRAVLVPKSVFESIGLYDFENFPHYGADTDFSFRAIRQGFSILINPITHVRLQTENTGLKHASSLHGAWQNYVNYLTKRKNGEAITVWWGLTRKHLPRVNGVATFLFIITLNTFRYWSATLRHLR